MDVMLNMGQSHPFDYKKSVLQHDPDTTWNTLVSMGRPMWHSYVMTKPWNHRGIFILATSKLLCGLSPFNKESYGASSLQGVASLMCRLGLRPQSHSGFATQAVSDFMAVLHYVNYTYDAHISGYVTEPVLTFGATHLWYEIDPLPLEEYILPQFLELLMQGRIDVGSVGEVVARIILLLAMDATTMGEDGFRAYRLSGTGSKRFKGQFCSVKQLLGLLDGSLKLRTGLKCDNVPNDATEKDNNAKSRRELFNVIDEENATTGAATPEQRDSFELWMNDWGNWCVGFSHFVELTDLPTTAMLWCLLGRRAAGVFPRDHEEAQLVIPVFCKDTAEVSFILVKVWNEETTDWEFPQSALRNLSPASVFAVNEEEESKHEFSELSPRRIIRIYMSLRECDISIPAQSYLIDNASATSVDDVSYTLCLRGMCCSPRLGSVSSLRNWPFLLTLKIADQLARLAASAWWDPLAKVNVDMARRRFFKELIPDEELKEAVCCTLKIPGDGGRGDF
ncbi:hypothetical protein PInf_004012 [Phytophthora infestans]|nr:hypothetical protein PInf_004012 [Phytophthora infestans]